MPIYARRLDQTHDRSCPLAAAKRPGEQPVRAPKCPRPDQVLDLVVVDTDKIDFVAKGLSRPPLVEERLRREKEEREGSELAHG